MNLFTQENIYNGRVSSSTTNVGEIVTRNGQPAYRIGAAPYWSGSDATSKNIAKGQFIPNTQYVFSIWLDTDDIYYSTISANVPGGLTVGYTDDTSFYVSITGNRDNPKGFQHVLVFSDSSKSISGVGVYYYLSTPAYYRLDSFIAPASAVSLSSNGIVTVNNTSELYDIFSLEKGGLLGTTSICEY